MNDPLTNDSARNYGRYHVGGFHLYWCFGDSPVVIAVERIGSRAHPLSIYSNAIFQGQLSQWIALFVIVSGLWALNGWTFVGRRNDGVDGIAWRLSSGLSENQIGTVRQRSPYPTAALASVMILMTSRSPSARLYFLECDGHPPPICRSTPLAPRPYLRSAARQLQSAKLRPVSRRSDYRHVAYRGSAWYRQRVLLWVSASQLAGFACALGTRQ